MMDSTSLHAFLECLLLGPIALLAAAALDAKGAAGDDVARARQAVETDARLQSGHAAISHIDHDALGRILPGWVFFNARFRQFPVAQAPPAGLRSSNVFAVGQGSKVVALMDAGQLEKFFRDHQKPAVAEEQLKDAARAWVLLSVQFHQDGFYTFQLLDDATHVGGPPQARTAAATVVVAQGGSGTLSATLSFDRAGKLARVQESNKLRPGPRPICQATKLLDPDTLVRRMAERDLIIMGAAAEEYLLEQRAAAPAALREAIDHVRQRIARGEK
jgi:hypothetical protein